MIETWRNAPARYAGCTGGAHLDPAGLGLRLHRGTAVEVARRHAGLGYGRRRRVARLVVGRKLDRRCRKRGSIGDAGNPWRCCARLRRWSARVLRRAVQFRERPGVIAAVGITALNYLLVAWLATVVIGGIGRAIASGFFRQGQPGCGVDPTMLSHPRHSRRSVHHSGCRRQFRAQHHADHRRPRRRWSGRGAGDPADPREHRRRLVLFADKPVRVGEFCAFGDKMGTVEAIGLRSTRIRSLDRTPITVPNAEFFAAADQDNFTRRDMNLFQCSIGLRYETTADQLRYVAAKIRKLLIQHSKVLPDPARVRLSEFGASAYVLDVFALVQCADWNEFLAVKEDLNLRIIDIVAESGTGFAFPSQTVYLAAIPAWIRTAHGQRHVRCRSGGTKGGCRSRSSISPSEPRWRERSLLPSSTSTIARLQPARPGTPAAARKPPPRNRWAALLRRRAPTAPADATSA